MLSTKHVPRNYEQILKRHTNLLHGILANPLKGWHDLKVGP